MVFTCDSCPHVVWPLDSAEINMSGLSVFILPEPFTHLVKGNETNPVNSWCFLKRKIRPKKKNPCKTHMIVRGVLIDCLEFWSLGLIFFPLKIMMKMFCICSVKHGSH